jgi:hypothetical protein
MRRRCISRKKVMVKVTRAKIIMAPVMMEAAGQAMPKSGHTAATASFTQLAAEKFIRRAKIFWIFLTSPVNHSAPAIVSLDDDIAERRGSATERATSNQGKHP